MKRTTRRVITGAAAVSAGALLLGPITALAQGDEGTTTTTSPPASTTPSAKPGTSGAPKDASTWITNVLDNLVKSGVITQTQADAITKALQAARPTFEHGPGGRWGGPGRVGLGADVEAAAKALGISIDELRTELQTKSLAQIAADHKIDIQKVIDALAAAAKTKLDDAVKAGRLTQTEADTRLKELTDRLTNLVNQKLPMPGDRHGGWPGHRKGDTTGSTTTTTPTSTPTTTPGGS
jgi:hypothetical protein